MPLTPDQLAARKEGRCEWKPRCPRPASWILSNPEKPLESWRYCSPHSQVGPKSKWHVARIKENA